MFKSVLIFSCLAFSISASEETFQDWIKKVDVSTSNEIGNRDVNLAKEYSELQYALTPLRSVLNDIHSTSGQARIFDKLKRMQPPFWAELSSNDNLAECLAHIEIVANDTIIPKLYALRMWDSWGIPESGILEGNVRWPGHYYECMESVGPQVKGRYCLSYVGFKYVPVQTGIPVDITFGSCLPSVCSTESIKTILGVLLKGHTNIPLLETSCPKTVKNYYTTLDIIGITITSILAALVVIGTSVDLFNQWKIWKSNKINENQPNLYKATQCKSAIGFKIALCFSAIKNGKEILSLERKPGILPVLDGLRFISTTWVILGHTLLSSLYYLDNAVNANRTIKDKLGMLMPVINGTFSVDTFFFLSGLLVMYLGLKHLTKTNGKINIPLMYLQRFLRLTPTYAYLILFSMGWMKFVGSGPYWETLMQENINMCIETWWTNLVYINNFYPVSSLCFSWGWYLAVDMQFYIFSPLFIILLHKNKRLGLALLAFISVSSVIITGVLSALSNLQPTAIQMTLSLTPWIRFFLPSAFSNSTASYDRKFLYDIYNMPWTRFTVYGIGMFTGYVLFVTKGKIRLHKSIALLGWLVSAGCALAVIYGTFKTTSESIRLDTPIAAFYNAMSRGLWGACIAWVTVACIGGYGGPVTVFLDWNVFTPLSRLTYSAYLVHILILQWYFGINDHTYHFLVQHVIVLYLGIIVMVFMVAFAITLLVEWPFIGILKLAFPGKSKPTPTINKSTLAVSESSVEMKDVLEGKTNQSYYPGKEESQSADEGISVKQFEDNLEFDEENESKTAL